MTQLYSYVRKEAVLSSQIEGTQSSLSDLLLYEINEQPGVPVDDAHEVSRCVAALDYGLAKLRGGLPLSMRLLIGTHKELLTHPRGRGKTPGELRRSQVWIGGTRPGNAAFVPSPANELASCLGSMERFLNDEPEMTPPLLKAALIHVQFETIHVFLDGIGRLGRLLIVLQLVADGILRTPMLYPSLFFETHRAPYFALLALINADQKRIASLGRAAASALEVHQALQQQPISNSNALVKIAGLTAATVNKSLAHLEKLRIATELTSDYCFPGRCGSPVVLTDPASNFLDGRMFPSTLALSSAAM